ncbi:sensor histidine kinase [Nocardioides sp. zg-579]|uniref:Oxygen sensor histidine kinase NreB n=1 Tax=Nocardioides marmotae TaxID=2663857 RepID=A0A6I3JDG4_9ACTN|nr:histidine kinase [Nocardioides marmotae]MCR6032444.1 sensor histidine kinase [Gordonia jinghuaiqii]MTB96093.1 sensor histidine kinase [Nocardioides marmotae]QKD99825.1 sensor histidine kinase [Nocardioides marmotae]
MSTPLPDQRPPRRLGPRGRRWFDVLVVVGLLLPAVPLWFSVGPVSSALSVLQVGPLLWRRRHPVAVFWAVTAAHAAQVLLLDEPTLGQVAWPVAVYSVARYAAPVHGWAALAVSAVAALTAAIDWSVGSPDTALTVLTNAILIGAVAAAAWALGTLGRTRQAYVDALVERSDRVQREAAQQVALAAADERARIAREMHDVVAHGLSVIVVQADGARYAARTDPDVAARTLETVAATGREALTEMRRMLGLLRAEDAAVDGGPALRPQPGLADLDALVAEARTAGARVEARLPDPAATTGIADGVGLTAYRVVQEALTNVRKHAGPEVAVRVEVAVAGAGRDRAVVVRVEDDGRGASAEDDGRGLGLLGMRERVGVHGGTLEAGPRAGGGFTVSARIPA